MRSGMFRLHRLAIVSVLVCAFACTAATASFGAESKLRVRAARPDFVLHGQDAAGAQVVIENAGDVPISEKIAFSEEPSAPALIAFSEPEYQRSSVYGGSTNSVACNAVASGWTCSISLSDPLPPGASLYLRTPFTVVGESGVVTDKISVSGGGTVGQDSEDHVITIGQPGPLGFTNTTAELVGGDGGNDIQAASDPAEFATTLDFTSYLQKVSTSSVSGGAVQTSVEDFKDVITHLPVGLVGNPTIAPTCTAAELVEEVISSLPNGQGSARIFGCPLDSQVGTARVTLSGELFTTQLYNMVAPPGSATELGFDVLGVSILLDAYVRPGDNGIDVVSRDTSTTLPVSGARITVWGDPADKSHDSYRGACLPNIGSGPDGAVCPATMLPKTFLRLPTSCFAPLQFGAESNSYEHPDVYAHASFTSPALTGCERVSFSPEIGVFPTGTAASSPTGVSVRLSAPQNSNPEGLGEADLKKAVVRLPLGMALNPSSADGLQACTDAQLHLGQSAPAECPDGSKVGTVLLHTPLLAEPIEGTVYVRSQNSSDPASGEMFRIAIELRNDPRGIDIKVPGQVAADPVTGQLTTTFDNNPQLPFSDITLSFKAGARAPLTTPASCLPQNTEADLYSWAQPDVSVHRSSSFSLTSGPEGTLCVARQGFSPGFNAGVSSVQAGGFTPFLTTFTRKDADQGMQRVSVKLPLGVSGSLVGLPLCSEAQASTGTCSHASEIGSVTAGAGSGPTPFYVTGGKVFMTGPYEGAPFGLSIVVPAKAGPFDLGNVNVRAKVEVDPRTAQLTVTSDPLPLIVGGVPVNLRLVNVTINRSGFTFNPTNCDPLSVTGTMTGGQGAIATVANRFQVTNCGALAFKPVFKVSTPGKTSRKNGAGLDVKLTYPALAFGKDANIAKVKVSLPKQLPSRLTTLQKACTAQTFETNPAACPTASKVGTATASTPIIPVPLLGPVYFVSHGGEAFPDLVIVLQGYGVTVDLVGSTFINEKTNVTSTTFKQIPDVPVGSFELKLPQGPNSALAAIGNLCTSKLKMPTAFVAQDGAEIHESTPITTTGCGKGKAKKAIKHKKK